MDFSLLFLQTFTHSHWLTVCLLVPLVFPPHASKLGSQLLNVTLFPFHIVVSPPPSPSRYHHHPIQNCLIIMQSLYSIGAYITISTIQQQPRIANILVKTFTSRDRPKNKIKKFRIIINIAVKLWLKLVIKLNTCKITSYTLNCVVLENNCILYLFLF